MKTINNINFRQADIRDINYIYNSLRNMAEEEKILERFKYTQKDLQKMIFEDNLAEVLLANIGNNIAGFVVYSMTNRNFTLFDKPGLYLHDIYVEPQKRRLGIARGIIQELKNIAKKRNLGRIDFVVLKSNDLGLKFWRSLNGVKEVEYIYNMRIALDSN